MMWNKKLEEITLADINELQTERVGEKKDIDYKRELKYRQAEDKREFLADVVSFANTVGGYLIYGIEEENGFPNLVVGTVLLQESDKEELNIQQVIRDNIVPRIQNIGVRILPLDNGRYIVVLHIPQSFSTPHMIKSPHTFYARHSNGKYPLDITEIRAVFNQSEGIMQRIKDFRLERLAAIIAKETLMPIPDGPKIVLHVCPYQSIATTQSYDVFSRKGDLACKPILSGGYLEERPNFDGLCVFRGKTDDGATSYVQLFKSGRIESVETQFFFGNKDNKRGLHTLKIETGCTRALKQYLQVYQQLEIRPPFDVMLSLVSVNGYIILPDERSVLPNMISIRKDNLLCESIYLEGYEIDSKTLLPAYEAIWNAGGYERDLNYDTEGKWRGWRGRNEGFE